MRILVAHASRHGATQVIAIVVGRVLRQEGHTVDVAPVEEVRELGGYDAVVVGSAVYGNRWMKQAADFVHDHRAVLSGRPVWLFSSAPLGTVRIDPKELPELRRSVAPRGHVVLPGALDPADLTFRDRVLRRLPSASALLPAGDFRDWDEVEGWAAASRTPWVCSLPRDDRRKTSRIAQIAP